MSPTYYDLGPNDHFLVSVKFSPESPGPHTARLLFVCDNCQIRELWLNGNACVASVSVESVDLRDGNGSREPLLAPESGALQAYQETVDFEELSVYDERTVTVRTKDRGTVASILTSLSFSATVSVRPSTVATIL